MSTSICLRVAFASALSSPMRWNLFLPARSRQLIQRFGLPELSPRAGSRRRLERSPPPRHRSTWGMTVVPAGAVGVARALRALAFVLLRPALRRDRAAGVEVPEATWTPHA